MQSAGVLTPSSNSLLDSLPQELWTMIVASGIDEDLCNIYNLMLVNKKMKELIPLCVSSLNITCCFPLSYLEKLSIRFPYVTSIDFGGCIHTPLLRCVGTYKELLTKYNDQNPFPFSNHYLQSLNFYGCNNISPDFILSLAKPSIMNGTLRHLILGGCLRNLTDTLLTMLFENAMIPSCNSPPSDSPSPALSRFYTPVSSFSTPDLPSAISSSTRSPTKPTTVSFVFHPPGSSPSVSSVFSTANALSNKTPPTTSQETPFTLSFSSAERSDPVSGCFVNPSFINAKSPVPVSFSSPSASADNLAQQENFKSVLSCSNLSQPQKSDQVASANIFPSSSFPQILGTATPSPQTSSSASVSSLPPTFSSAPSPSHSSSKSYSPSFTSISHLHHPKPVKVPFGIRLNLSDDTRGSQFSYTPFNTSQMSPSIYSSSPAAVQVVAPHVASPSMEFSFTAPPSYLQSTAAPSSISSALIASSIQSSKSPSITSQQKPAQLNHTNSLFFPSHPFFLTPSPQLMPSFTLRELNIADGYRLTDRSAFAIASHCPLLEILFMADCYAISEKGLCAIVEGCKHLKALSLERCGVTSKVISYIALHCKDLECLIIDHITSREVGRIVAGCEQLKVLRLSYGNVLLSSSETARLLSGLKDLSCLELSSNGALDDLVNGLCVEWGQEAVQDARIRMCKRRLAVSKRRKNREKRKMERRMLQDPNENDEEIKVKLLAEDEADEQQEAEIWQREEIEDDELFNKGLSDELAEMELMEKMNRKMDIDSDQPSGKSLKKHGTKENSQEDNPISSLLQPLKRKRLRDEDFEEGYSPFTTGSKHVKSPSSAFQSIYSTPPLNSPSNISSPAVSINLPKASDNSPSATPTPESSPSSIYVSSSTTPSSRLSIQSAPGVQSWSLPSAQRSLPRLVPLASRLTYLSFRGGTLSVDGFRQLAQNASNLRFLSLSGTFTLEASTGGWAVKDDVVESTEKEVEKGNCTSDTAKEVTSLSLFTFAQSLQTQTTSLQTFEFPRSNLTGEHVLAFAFGARWNPEKDRVWGGLTKLIITDCLTLTDKIVTVVVDTFPTLTHLILRRCPLLTPDGLFHCLHANLPSLHSLDLFGSQQMTSSAVYSLLVDDHLLPSVNSIYLSDNQPPETDATSDSLRTPQQKQRYSEPRRFFAGNSRPDLLVYNRPRCECFGDEGFQRGMPWW
ncbi:uncharacterized protein MONOS_387 [Monocercomonoides exilis]|uniref:uncharacterized protein n=1 Tax=Monocercomonoides exilis TaxID=2049356 RepID=UPI003559AF41|nr:hypothetical protein MONOS_387 [Monocercomonoides exilis]|eukprot:MONOS_387.1-p1 / transcript=MONOS_387.1 / gene=MONOS_387 / organism=Monocercomonoides_exilis_PA203 / gene_product=unspecified product / transcript_product=unspecified product / location=Mono_scaffold00006:174174-178293(+) / protein_length=1191 / sequence_SO=supercontig / SO=protein_coding / is_pseudo=false